MFGGVSYQNILSSLFIAACAGAVAYRVASPSKEQNPKLKSVSKTKNKENEIKKTPCSSNEFIDIEDLVGQSLIPLTLKQMTRDSVRPYTLEEKTDKVLDLESLKTIPNFAGKLREAKIDLKRVATEVMQLNIGFYCNQACSHCHVDSSPNRKEMMSRRVAEKCVSIMKNSPTVKVVDLTGGAPELNREFRYIVKECFKLGLEIIDRCNLTVLLEPHQSDLVSFLAAHKVRVIASLPCYIGSNVDTQRGDQIFIRSIKGLQMLNTAGYGRDGSGLVLDLVYNPTGVHLPPERSKLEIDYKRVLKEDYDIVFNDLHCITNMPINRFYDHLQTMGKLEVYMEILRDNFNEGTTQDLMCRSYISVDPSGTLFDCDFNQQLDLTLNRPGKKERLTVFDIDSSNDLSSAKIRTKKHCYGCTAGAGSS